MADKIWVSTDGDFGAAASWNPSGMPVDADRVFFTDASQYPVLTGVQDMMDENLALFHVFPEYTGNLGGVGNYLRFAAAAIKHEGRGSLYFEDSSDEAANPGEETSLIEIDSDNATGAAFLQGDDVGVIHVYKGRVTITGAMAALDDLEVSYRNNQADDAKVIVEAGAGTITDILQNGGQIECHAIVTNCHRKGGVHWQHTAKLVHLWNHGGTLMYHYPCLDVDNVIIYVLGGVVDFQQAKVAQEVDRLVIFPGGTVYRNDALLTVIETVAIRGGGSYESYGGAPGGHPFGLSRGGVPII